MTDRPPYETRSLIIRSDQQRRLAQAWIDKAPEGIEVIMREVQKKRSPSKNAALWAGILKDFADQGWVNGRKFSETVWHEYLKEKFLPEHYIDGLTLDGYMKWEEMPDGKLRMVGSTTKLTERGMSQYMTECTAFGAGELGIRFTAKPEQR